MVIAHNPDTTVDYVLKVDREQEDAGETGPRTVWTLRPLREGEMVTILDGPEKMGAAELASLTVRMGLVRVSGFRDENGRDVAVDRPNGGIVSRAFMDRMNWRWMAELAKEVCQISGLDVSDVEKPGPSPTE